MHSIVFITPRASPLTASLAVLCSICLLCAQCRGRTMACLDAAFVASKDGAAAAQVTRVDARNMGLTAVGDLRACVSLRRLDLSHNTYERACVHQQHTGMHTTAGGLLFVCVHGVCGH